MQCIVRVAPIALSVLMACGPAAPEVSTGGSTSTGGEASTGAAPTTGAASTDTGEQPPTSTGPGTGAPTTTDAPPTTDATSDGSTTDATSDGSTTTGPASATTGDETTAGTDSTGADETTAALELVTRAWWVDGMELQIRVIQEDPAAGLCRGLLLGLEEMGPDNFESVAAPPLWGVRTIFVHAGPGACHDPYTWYENGPAFPDDATGTIVFHDVDNKGKPATLDIDVTATYAPGEPWTPASDTLVATAVTVEVG